MSKRKSKPKRKSSRRATSKRSRFTKRVPKKKPFGGYTITFNGCDNTLEEVFGKKPISPSIMTKLLWKFVKRKRIGGIK